MVSLSVSSEYVALAFVAKAVVLRRLPGEQVVEERILPVDQAKSDKSTAITDGSNPSVCSALSHSGRLFVVASGKRLVLWETTDWSMKGSKNLVRAASCVAFSSTEDRILLSDKSGDAYIFKTSDFHSVGNNETPENAHVLGHVSMLLRVASSPDDRFIITCDRDEKIRVSHFPNAYNIHTYCLGHTDAVTCFDIPSGKPEILISGSSDGTVRYWEYHSGKHLLTFRCSAEEALIIDLASLPVDENSFLVCILLKKSSFVRLLLTDFSENSPKCTHLEDVPTACATPLSLSARGNELFVVSVDSPNFVTAFRNHGPSLVPCKILNDHLQDCLRKYSDNFVTVTENVADDRLFTYLNKRKIDDTQDYYKRKNERLLGSK